MLEFEVAIVYYLYGDHMSHSSVSGPGSGTEPVPGSGLRDFAKGGPGNACPPGPDLAAAVAALTGPDWCCPGATDDELIGLLGRWAALESWAAAGKLGVVRELIRRRAAPGARSHGDLPDTWEDDLSHEVAPALALSLPAADKLAAIAWELQARLPGIGAALANGTIDYLKASLIFKELFVLDDAHASQAEALILPELAGKPAGQIARAAALAVSTVDPEGARKRREYAEREDARVRLWRENSGASAMAAYGLPTDAALSANANIDQRAHEYKQAGVMPDARMDQLRVLAFADILNGITAPDRIAQARADNQDGRPRDDDDEDPGGGSGVAPGSGTTGPVLPARSNLTLPLATLLGLADRPGEAHGLGALDPALVCDLAAATARSPHSQWCLTITDTNGYAIGHGCFKAARTRRRKSSAVRNRDGPWIFTPLDGTGPSDGLGIWLLTLPDGRELTVQLGPVPLTECDHRHESDSYQPSDTLRHLVQIRDGHCTFPCCSRHARDCDFEHAVPYDKGGRTCACNAGARSRRCHRVKQSKQWSLTQPRPGWHRWTAPSGRSYTQGPMKYPA